MGDYHGPAMDTRDEFLESVGLRIIAAGDGTPFPLQHRWCYGFKRMAAWLGDAVVSAMRDKAEGRC